VSALVVVTDVGFRYGLAERVLDGVSATFDEAQVHSITGPSGCGKSTLLYLIGLMLRPANGSIEVAGRVTSGGRDRERALVRGEHIGFVFQDALLEPSMTVFENIAEGLPLNRPLRRYRAEAAALLERVGLGELRDRKASRLSGGQAQRVALVRAMLKGPAVLLADEPTGNLDDTSASVVLAALFEYGRQPGHTCIVVTHDQRIAAATDTVTRLEAARE